jgi:hypothetical protein
MAQSGIYVETFVRGTIDELWEKTQDPHLHQRWDLRFSTIGYLPRGSESEPQRFLYTTRLGFGMSIAGAGESTGTREINGERTSALKFWSEHPMSLILEGTGYWKYIPTAEGIRFLTWYDYQPRFGRLGQQIDRVFRPAIGWATAWSFDRLRLWVERGVPPETSRNRSLVFAASAATAATLGATALLFRRVPRKTRFLLSAVALGALFISFATARTIPRASRCLRTKPE